MQINLFQNIKNINNNRNIQREKVYSTPVAFCGADAFAHSAMKFSKEQCIEVVKKLLEKKNVSEVLKTMSQLKKSDPDLIELNNLILKYKTTFSLEDKIILLKHQEKMHWQELETPELGLVRTFSDMKKAGIKNYLTPAMNISSINGLNRTINQAYDAVGYKYIPNEKNFNSLKTLIENTSDDSPFSYDIKKFALKIAAAGKNEDDDFIKLAQYLKENTKNKDLKKYANSWIKNIGEYNESELLERLSNKKLAEFEKTSAIKTLSANKSQEFTKQIPFIIDNPKVSQEAKLSVIWAAGKCKSNENFNLLLKLTNDTDPSNSEAREMALHSLSLYLKTNEVEVKATLHNLIKEKSDLSELAQILLEKSEGRYYTKNRELANLTEAEKTTYEKLRNKYVKTNFKINNQQQNIIDRALVLFKKPLAQVLNKNTKMYIMNDTCTNVYKREVGKRLFTENPAYGGEFFDSIIWIANLKRIFMSKSALKEKSKYNGLAHEFNHAFYYYCISDSKDVTKLSALYKKALKQNKCLDDYAQLTEKEYFAQGYEAYSSVYKPHGSILDNKNFSDYRCHIRSTLKRIDPELYKFIEYCIKKYNDF